MSRPLKFVYEGQVQELAGVFQLIVTTTAIDTSLRQAVVSERRACVELQGISNWEEAGKKAASILASLRS